MEVPFVNAARFAGGAAADRLRLVPGRGAGARAPAFHGLVLIRGAADRVPRVPYGDRLPRPERAATRG